MLPTPRTQPYRANQPREITAALQAMLAGRQPGVVNGGDFARQRSQMQAGGGVNDLAMQELAALQQQRQRRPVATINAPHQRFEGNFTPQGTPLEALLQQLMNHQAPRRPLGPMMGAPAGAVGPAY